MAKPDPFLVTSDYIREALDDIFQRGSEKSINPLQSLYLIDLYLLSADFSFVPNPHLFALNEFLISTIHQEYNHQRQLLNLSSIAFEHTWDAVKDIIREDVAAGNTDLIGWSWLNFHYVESNLRISQQMFCDAGSLDDRTLRRYQRSTLELFAEYLIRLEQQAREERRKQILYLELPHQGAALTPIEREKEIQTLRKSPYKHRFVVGAAGIGKTVLIEQVLQEQIDNDEIDHLIWINEPETVEIVQNHLHGRLLAVDAKISLAQYLSLKRVTVVLDHVERLQAKAESFHTLLRDLSNADVFLISRLFYAIPDCLGLELAELSFAAVENMIRLGRVQNDFDIPISAYARSLWQSVGGNPLAIELLSQNGSVFKIETASALSLNQIYSQLFNSLTPPQQLAWLLLDLLAGTPVDFGRLSKIKLLDMGFSDFEMIVRLGIVKPSNSKFALTLSASQYIRLSYKSSGALQGLLTATIKQIVSSFSEPLDLNLVLIESILLADWIDLEFRDYLGAAQIFWKIGIHKGHYTNWYAILGKHFNALMPENLELVIAYGICLRYLGQWDEAKSVFDTVALNAGMKGLFHIQAEALLELAVLMHYQGNYSDLVQLLDHVENLPKRIVSDLRYRIMALRIEIATEQNDLLLAKSLLERLPDEAETQTLMLRLEVMAQDTKLERHAAVAADSLANRLLFEYRDNPSAIVRAHVLMGRIYQNVKDKEAAIRHLVIAQDLLLEADNDPFALARTQSNLAALFIEEDQLNDARNLLKSSEHVQRQIGDRVGLATTMHNIQVLERKIVS